MNDEEDTRFNAGAADVVTAWMFALAILLILLAWSLA
jgi:hypothetical protein